jgi:hypothetical protein
MTRIARARRIAPFVLAFVPALWLAPARASAQLPAGTITVGAGPSVIRAEPGARFAVPVTVDMSAAGGGVDLAALTTKVSWDPARARLDSVKRGAGSFGTLIHNPALAADGSVVFSVYNGTGTRTTVTVAILHFTAAASPGETRLTVAATVAGNEVGQNIIGRVRSRATAV